MNSKIATTNALYLKKEDLPYYHAGNGDYNAQCDMTEP